MFVLKIFRVFNFVVKWAYENYFNNENFLIYSTGKTYDNTSNDQYEQYRANKKNAFRRSHSLFIHPIFTSWLITDY
jgi:hypothetical protein